MRLRRALHIVRLASSFDACDATSLHTDLCAACTHERRSRVRAATLHCAAAAMLSGCVSHREKTFDGL
jgi:hypothetical protein